MAGKRIRRKRKSPILHEKTTVPEATPANTQERGVVQLQHIIGNQAVKRMVTNPGFVQRELPSLVPRLSNADLEAIVGNPQPVREWLGEHHTDLTLMTDIYAIVHRIRQEVAAASKFSTNELVMMIRKHAKDNYIPLNPAAADSGGKNTSMAALKSAAEAGLSLSATTTIGEDKGKITLSTSGATAEIMNKVGTESASINVGPGGVTQKGKSGSTTVSGGIKWDGEFNFSVGHDDLEFEASVSPDKWKIGVKLGDGPLPDANAISEIFHKAEAAFRSGAKGVISARGPEDIKNAISNNLGDVKSAVTTAQKIQKAAKGQFGAKLEVFGPMPGGDDKAQAQGVGVTFNLTFTF